MSAVRDAIEKELAALRARREGLDTGPDPMTAGAKALAESIGLRIYELEMELLALAEKMPRRF